MAGPAEDSRYEMILHTEYTKGSPLCTRKTRINSTSPRKPKRGRRMSISRGSSSSTFHRQFLDSNLSSSTATTAHGLRLATAFSFDRLTGAGGCPPTGAGLAARD